MNQPRQYGAVGLPEMKSVINMEPTSYGWASRPGSRLITTSGLPEGSAILSACVHRAQDSRMLVVVYGEVGTAVYLGTADFMEHPVESLVIEEVRQLPGTGAAEVTSVGRYCWVTQEGQAPLCVREGFAQEAPGEWPDVEECHFVQTSPFPGYWDNVGARIREYGSCVLSGQVSTTGWLYLRSSLPVVSGFDVGVSIGNTTAGTLSVERYVAGTGWSSVAGLSDGTDVSGAPLAQTGIIGFTECETARCSVDELLGFWWRIKASVALDAATTVTGLRVRSGFQAAPGVGGGGRYHPESMIYQDTSCGVYLDFTDVLPSDTGFGLIYDGGGMGSSDAVYVGGSYSFDDVRFELTIGGENRNAATLSVAAFVNGAWVACTLVENNTMAVSGKTWGRNGNVVFVPASGWRRESFMGGVGCYYWIRFKVSSNLTATTCFSKIEVNYGEQVELSGEAPVCVGDRMLFRSSSPANYLVSVSGDRPFFQTNLETVWLQNGIDELYSLGKRALLRSGETAYYVDAGVDLEVAENPPWPVGPGGIATITRADYVANETVMARTPALVVTQRGFVLADAPVAYELGDDCGLFQQWWNPRVGADLSGSRCQWLSALNRAVVALCVDVTEGEAPADGNTGLVVYDHGKRCVWPLWTVAAPGLLSATALAAGRMVERLYTWNGRDLFCLFDYSSPSDGGDAFECRLRTEWVGDWAAPAVLRRVRLIGEWSGASNLVVTVYEGESEAAVGSVPVGEPLPGGYRDVVLQSRGMRFSVEVSCLAPVLMRGLYLDVGL